MVRMAELIHGKASTYNKFGCRCDSCTAAAVDAVRRHRLRSAERLAADPNSAEHGTVTTYTMRMCRCGPCRRANANRTRHLTRSRAERLAADPTLAEHGKASTYRNWMCRCRPCTDAHGNHQRAARGASKVPNRKNPSTNESR